MWTSQQGYCAPTADAVGDCAAGGSGSWHARENGITRLTSKILLDLFRSSAAPAEQFSCGNLSSMHCGLLAGCATLCRNCNRCRYVSLSMKNNDCSWFHDCELPLHDSDIYNSVQVRKVNASELKKRASLKYAAKQFRSALQQHKHGEALQILSSHPAVAGGAQPNPQTQPFELRHLKGAHIPHCGSWRSGGRK